MQMKGQNGEIESDDEDLEGAKKSLQGLYPLFCCRDNGSHVCGGIFLGKSWLKNQMG